MLELSHLSTIVICCAYKADLRRSNMTIWLGGIEGVRKVKIVRTLQAVEILIEMSVEVSHIFAPVAPQFSMSAAL